MNVVDRLDDVGLRLLCDDEQDRGLTIEPGRRKRVTYPRCDRRDGREPHQRAAGRPHDDWIIVGGVKPLIIGGDGLLLLRTIEKANRAGRVGFDNCGAHVLHPEPHRGERDGIYSYADGGLLSAAYSDLGDTLDLRDALHDDRVSDIVNCAGGDGIRCEGKYQDWRGRGIALPKIGHVRPIRWQIARGGIDRGLYGPRRTFDAPMKVGLHRDTRRDQGTDASELRST